SLAREYNCWTFVASLAVSGEEVLSRRSSYSRHCRRASTWGIFCASALESFFITSAHLSPVRLLLLGKWTRAGRRDTAFSLAKARPPRCPSPYLRFVFVSTSCYPHNLSVADRLRVLLGLTPVCTTAAYKLLNFLYGLRRAYSRG